MTKTKLYRLLLSGIGLSTFIFYGVATAAELPKEGSFTGTYSGYGTWKGTAIGKGRFVSTWDENGFKVGTGFLDHTTWHCFGLNDTTAGITEGHGYCVVTDTDGDQMVANIVLEKHAADAKSWKGAGTFTSGSGKYTGITGSVSYLVHVGEFRPTTEGTYFNYSDPVQASYSLPAQM